MEEFEERAIATATYKPIKIWKRYVDETFTVLGKDYVDGFYSLLFVLPWKSRKITLSPFPTRQFQGIQTVFSPPLFTERPPTLTNTYIASL